MHALGLKFSRISLSSISFYYILDLTSDRLRTLSDTCLERNRSCCQNTYRLRNLLMRNRKMYPDCNGNSSS